MPVFPVLESLDVSGFAMYPGKKGNEGLAIKFRPGLTLVLGANGLGKTTLVNLIFRILTGPYDLRNVSNSTSFGGSQPELRDLTPFERRTFANRVTDGAKDASAHLTFSVGDDILQVSRSMRDLSLTALTVNGNPAPSTEAAYRDEILRMGGLNSFAEWILILRLLTFYFEDRRALVWDRRAQLQLLRVLFLSKEQSGLWVRRYKDILELDSLVRNLTYVFNKETRSVSKVEQALGDADDIRRQIRTLEKVQAQEQDRLAEVNERLIGAGAARQNTRLNFLRSQQAHESAIRSLERMQLKTIQAAFPDATTTGQYILGHILSDDHCLACGNHVPEFAAEIRARIVQTRCPMCGTQQDQGSERAPTARRLKDAVTAVARAAQQVQATDEEREATEKDYDSLLQDAAALTTSTANRDAHLVELVKRLPPDEREVHEQRRGLNSMQATLAMHREKLAGLRKSFQVIQDDANVRIEESARLIQSAFQGFASGFLFEECSLAWTIYPDRVGEGGGTVNLPAFQLDMTGAQFDTPVRRDGPQQVSESQREFIDLSFKMALMAVASSKPASLIVDAPESSLDAVFVTRAAEVLTRFGTQGSQNRLLITSNLIDGDLIPQLMKRAGIKSPKSTRVVDLLSLAAPTAATSAMAADYQAVRTALFEKAGGTG